MTEQQIITQYIEEEVLAFAKQGHTSFKTEDMKYAVWLRKQNDFNAALLEMIRSGELTKVASFDVAERNIRARRPLRSLPASR